MSWIPSDLIQNDPGVLLIIQIHLAIQEGSQDDPKVPFTIQDQLVPQEVIQSDL
jgi:hypothetical protein